jgi:hypothetical protein
MLRSRIFLGIISAGLMAGCDDKASPTPPPNNAPFSTPNQTVPDAAAVVANLREAKTSAENLVAFAKGELEGHPFRQRLSGRHLNDGATLYGQAEAAVNSAITRIRASLGTTPSADTRQAIEDNLARAQERFQAFDDWYNQTAQDEGLTAAAGPAFELSLDLGEVIVGVLNIHATSAKELRDRFAEDLSKCEWRNWNEIPALNTGRGR